MNFKLAGLITILLSVVLAGTGCIGLDLGDDLSSFGVEQVTYQLVNGTITIEDNVTDIIQLTISNDTFEDIINGSTGADISDFGMETGFTNDRLDITEVELTATNETLTVEVNFEDMDLDTNITQFSLDINIGLNQNISAIEDDEDFETITITASDTNTTTTITWESEIEDVAEDDHIINATIGINKLTYEISLDYFNGTEYNSSEEVETVSIVITSSIISGDEEDEEVIILMDVFPTPVEENEEETSEDAIIAFLTNPWVLFAIISIVAVIAIVTVATKKTKQLPTCPPGTYQDQNGNCREY